MKRTGGLFDEIAQRGNLGRAFWAASRGKRDYPEVREFGLRLDENLSRIAMEVEAGEYRFAPYRAFEVRDTKSRMIQAPAFRDRVLHHAMILVTGPVFEKGATDRSYACRAGRGQHAALARLRKWIHRKDWFLKVDVKRFYDSISHEILFGLLKRRFRESRLLDLFAALLDSYEKTPGKGLPIGALTSQYLGNFYLDVVDHHLLKNRSGLRGLRYMDDFLILGNSRELKAVESDLRGALGRLGLAPKEPVILNRCEQGVPYLCYTIYPDRMRLDTSGRRRLRRKLRGLEGQFLEGEIGEQELQDRSGSLFAHASHADDVGWRRMVCRFRDLGRGWKQANRVLRGGSWNNSATNCRSAYRNRNRPGNRNRNIGFRLGLFPGTARQCHHRTSPLPALPVRRETKPRVSLRPLLRWPRMGCRRERAEQPVVWRTMKPEIRVMVGKSEMVFRLIVDEKGAEFRMGSRGYETSEQPAHLVRLTKPYYLAETPVSQEQFEAWRDTDLYQDWFAENAELIKRTGYGAADAHENGFKDRPLNPAENVTWWEALAFARWLTPRLEGWYPGLPTEAQWEYACRDGSETEYWICDGSEALREVGWFSENSESNTQEVGQKRANGKGLFDLHGNVWEWCYDAFEDGVYRERISGCVDPCEVGSEEKAVRVLRGGSWVNSASDCRSAFRSRFRPGYRNGHFGFRLGLFPGPEQQVWPEATPGAEAGQGGTTQTALEREEMPGGYRKEVGE